MHLCHVVAPLRESLHSPEPQFPTRRSYKERTTHGIFVCIVGEVARAPLGGNAVTVPSRLVIAVMIYPVPLHNK